MKRLMSLLLLLCSLSISAIAQSGYKPGDVVTDFQLKNIDGKTVSLASVPEATGFIITFTCNHCPYAVAYEDRIIALHKKYAAKGYPVIAINPNDADKYPADSYEKMQERAKEKNFPFVYLYDETQAVAKRFGALRTPHMYVLKKEGNILRVMYVGAVDDNWEEPQSVKKKYVEEAVDALLAGKQVAQKETKAIGCSIKWK